MIKIHTVKNAFLVFLVKQKCRKIPWRIEFELKQTEGLAFLFLLPAASHEIAWADEEEDDVPAEAKDIIENLLCIDPFNRLGSNYSGGVVGVKEHPFFDGIDWRTLLLQKAEFVPSLEGEDDTSYFDSEQK